jgi:CNT family concentrative nucleoside transporter
MSKNIFPILSVCFLLLSSFTLSSCEKPSFKEGLINQWVSEHGEDVAFKIKGDNTFTSNSFGKELYGTYTLSLDSILDLSIPFQNKSLTIDSMVQVFDNQGTIHTDYYANKELVAQGLAGSAASVNVHKQYKIVQLSNNILVLKAENEDALSLKVKLDLVSSGSFSIVSILRGFLGMFFLLLVAFALSSDRKRINWRLVGIGVMLQFALALLVLKVPFVKGIFDVISKGFVAVLNFTKAGSEFLFGNLVTDLDTMGYIFAFQILPTIVFFAALTSALYYIGIIQWIVYAFAWIMSKTMRLSGAESLAAAGNIFLGQTESPLLVRPYLEKMTKSEIMCLMTGGMATIAGGVLGAYVGYLGGDSIQEQQVFASHLLAASIMSAPAAIVAAKMLVPETQAELIDTDLTISKEKIGSNILDAVSTGTRDGLKLAVNVGVMLLVFTAFMYMFNAMSFQIGDWINVNDKIAIATQGKFEGLTLQYILGMVFSPVAWLLGVEWVDAVLVGQLLGEKTILNEFFAYASLGKLKLAEEFQNQKSIIIATYALCGFANFASIGIQIGGISALAPNQQSTLAKLGIKALIGGTIACFMTATIAGMLF